MSVEQSYIGAGELIFDNDTHSGGFSVESIMKKMGFSPIVTLNDDPLSEKSENDKVSSLFEHLVVPSWVLTYGNQTGGRKYVDKDSSDDEDSVVDDDLHERLLDLVKEHNEMAKERKKRSTRKLGKKVSKKNTRKQK